MGDRKTLEDFDRLLAQNARRAWKYGVQEPGTLVVPQWVYDQLKERADG